MDNSVATGVFALAGTLVGGFFTYLTARIGQRWAQAKKDIAHLCDQVAAFYQLEQLYKEQMALVDPSKRSSEAIMKEMRGKVAASEEFVRPSMTSLAATKLRREWA